MKQVYCSVLCERREHRDTHSKQCVKPDCARPVRAKGLCSKHYKRQDPNHLATNAAWRAAHPEERRRSLRRKTQRRRAATFSAEAEPVDRDVVGDRDGWLCGLCTESVDNLLSYPDPMSPSLDHVTPLSLGGAHVYANVQITHLRCNVVKGNRAA